MSSTTSPLGTACQLEVPSPSSLRNLVPPTSPVERIAVPSGVPVGAASQAGAVVVPVKVSICPSVPLGSLVGMQGVTYLWWLMVGMEIRLLLTGIEYQTSKRPKE